MNRVYQLNIRLLDIEPAIWRRVLVPASFTLRELHAVIQGAMGWQDYHLHMFEIDGRSFEIPEDDNSGPEDGYEDERQRRLGEVAAEGTGFLYMYDFGDDWCHSVTVEEVLHCDPGRNKPHARKLPCCIDGARACPPEDCGGPYNYPEFLQALADPKHPDHREMADWGRGFQPESFDIEQANKMIRAFRALYRERRWGFREG